MDDLTSAKQLLAVDVLVVGGGIAGITAACAASSAGKSVCLIESRTYLGAEISATLRPWISQSQYTALIKLLPALIDCVKPDPHGDEFAIVPDLFKIALEDALLSSGVKILYNLRPIGYRKDARYYIEVAGKFGREFISASSVVDATEQAVMAQCTTAVLHRYKGKLIQAKRTLEFIGVDLEQISLQEQQWPNIVSDCRYHYGADKNGQLLIEHAIDCQMTDTAAWITQTEIQLRFTTMGLSKWLIENHAAFQKAKITATSYELKLPALYRIRSDKEMVRARSSDWDPASYRTMDGIWIAGGCADVDDHESRRLTDDLVALAELGREIGSRAAAGIRTGSDKQRDAQNRRLPLRTQEVDVLVIGGGSSGASAAMAAARSGAKTLVADMNPGLGGTGTIGGVDSYWFGRRSGFNTVVSCLVEEEHRWMRQEWSSDTTVKWNKEGKMHALLRGVLDAGATVFLNSMLAEVKQSDTGQVTGALLAAPDGLIEVQAKVIIDATGDGDAAVLAGADYVYGSEREALTMWYSMAPIVRPGLTRNNFTSSVDVGDAEDYTRAILSARRRYVGYDHSPYVAPRESRHIVGDVRLTLTDQLMLRKWPDVVNICFSNNDMKGHSSSDWVKMGLISPNLEVEIPLRAIIPRQLDGILVAGKAFSATHDALPAIRMQADLENLGAVCGITAAMSAAKGVLPRNLDITELQRELVRSDLLPQEVLTRDISDNSCTGEEMRSWIRDLNDQQQLYDYSNMGFLEVRREPIPIVMVCTAGSKIIPLLKEALTEAESPRRLSVARALAWYGAKEATPVLIEYIKPFLQEAELPPRRSTIKHVNAPPDQGAMPDLAYLLYTLAMCCDERAIAVIKEAQKKLKPTQEKFTDGKHGLFYYVDSICAIAEQLGHSDCVPILRKLREEPLFKDKIFYGVMQPDFFEERKAYLEIVIGRSLASCGDKEGIAILINYLEDQRRLLRRHAHYELKRISGEKFEANRALWLKWLEGVKSLPSRPWIAERGRS